MSGSFVECRAPRSVDLPLHWSLFDADGPAAFRAAYGPVTDETLTRARGETDGARAGCLTDTPSVELFDDLDQLPAAVAVLSREAHEVCGT